MRPGARLKKSIIPVFGTLFVLFFFFSDNKRSIRFEDLSLKRSQNVLKTIKHNEEYCIGYNFLEATEEFREDGLQPITLAVHGTSEMIEMIEKKPANWDGPISLGIFVDHQSSESLNYLRNFHRCNEEFQKKMTVHFAFRLSPFQESCPIIVLPEKKITCEEFLKNQKQHRKKIAAPFLSYPSNLMRNVARHGAKSDIHFIVDGDMVMSDGFANKIKPIANEMIDGHSKNLLVVRRFESNETHIPTTYEELKNAYKAKRVFEFHHKFFFEGHRIKNIDQWFNASESSDEITTWEIPYSSSLWEVQVILHRNDLYNAEYFPARIKVMQSLIYSLCRANYTFNLLSHVYNVHEGIKLDDTQFSKSVIAHSKKNGKQEAYNKYVKEMNATYPDTFNRCGKFIM